MRDGDLLVVLIELSIFVYSIRSSFHPITVLERRQLSILSLVGSIQQFCFYRNPVHRPNCLVPCPSTEGGLV